MTGSSDRRPAFCIAAFVLAAGVAVVSAQSAPALSALTVPAASLPEGCALTPPPPPTPTPTPKVMTLPNGNLVYVSVPQSREFPSNPWSGTDYKYILQMRGAFEHSPHFRMPDGPPLEPDEAAKLRARLMGDIAEAYVASYKISDREGVLVQAVRYTDAKWATPDPPMRALNAARRDSVETVRIVRDSTVILVSGNPQHACLTAVRNYIQSLK